MKTKCCLPCLRLRDSCIRFTRGNAVDPNLNKAQVTEEQEDKDASVVISNDGVVQHQGVKVTESSQSDHVSTMSNEELEEQFHIVDLNKDGYIDSYELKNVMKSLGIPCSEEEISAIIQHADANGSGKIEQDDFVKVMSDYLNSNAEESLDVKNLFDFFDTDKDGFITHQELQFAISEILQDSISEKEVGTMMRLACKKVKKSKSKDAMISFNDFQMLLEDVGFSV